MAKLSEKIYSTTNRLLKEGEEIRAVGQFSSGWSPLVGITLAAIGGALACLTFGISLILSLLGVLVLGVATKFWYVSVTNQRVIFTQLSFWGTPDLNKSYSVPLHYARISENRLLVQPVNSDLPQNFHFYFGAKSITGLDKSNFVLALTRSVSDSLGQDIAAQSVAVHQTHAFTTVEQQEERQQRKRRSWGWAFVIGSGLFALIGVCQTIGAIGYSFSPSAAEAVQKSGIIAIVAPLVCNGLWLVMWGVLLALSIRNLRSALNAEKQQPLRDGSAKPQLASNHVPPKKQPSLADSMMGQPQTHSGVEQDLLHAAEYGDVDQVKALLDSGVYVDAVDREKSTALGNAAVGGYVRVMEVLLDRGANVNAQNKDGITPLMRASGNGHIEAVKLLLARGADPHIVDREGLTALQYAEMLGRREIAQILREKMNL